MSQTTIQVEEIVRDELRSYKADYGLTYNEAIRNLLTESGWEFRHCPLDDRMGDTR